MYTQKHNREDDCANLYSFMHGYSFASLVTSKDNMMKANTEQLTIADGFCASSDSVILMVGEMMRDNLKR